jgi:pheromone shutdown protein TraB
MKSFLLPLAFLTLSLVGQDAPSPAPKPSTEDPAAKRALAPSDFIRYQEEGAEARLETAVKSYTNPDGVTVDLVGVVHIADLAYYETLNKLLADYDAVLYELVGDPAALQELKKGEGKEDGEADTDAKSSKAAAAANPLRAMQKMVGQLLRLTFQLDHIDYTKPNFVHADLSAEEFSKLQAAKGENIMTLLSRAMKMGNEGKLGIDEKDANLDLGQIFAALNGKGGSDALKIIMAKVFDKAESMVESFEGPDAEKGSVLLTERNKAVNVKLIQSIKAGKKKLSIFFGAGHLPGLETLIKAQGFKQTKETWLTAWAMKK